MKLLVSQIILTLILGHLPLLAVASNCANAIKVHQRYVISLSESAENLRRSLQELKDIRDMRSREERREAQLEYFSPKEKPFLDKALVLANWAMSTALALKIGQGFITDPWSLIPTLLLIPATMWSADFVSQIFHKWLDSYAAETNPIWGGSARAFRRHHEFPRNLNHLSYLSNTAAFARLMAPLHIVAVAASYKFQVGPEFGTALWMMLLLLANGTELHKQAHMSEPSAWAKKLQEARLILRREDHKRHHEAPNDTDFGIINGWSNAVTRNTDLWNHLDLIVWRLFKKMPHNWVQNPRSIPENVLESLFRDLSQVPQDLWVYGEFFPHRSSELINDLIEQSQAWQRAHSELRKKN